MVSKEKKVLPLLLLGLLLLGARPAISETATPRVEGVVDIPDFSRIRDIPTKKKAFFDFLRPIVVAENEKLRLQAKRLAEWQQRQQSGQPLAAQDWQWLQALARDYQVEFSGPQDEKAWRALRRRVDAVPLRLVLAQAANESSWGTSRFARQGHNFFGQWCFSKGCGLVPLRRSKGMKHEVASFRTVNDSVAAYLKNINTGRVYAPLRRLRARLHAQGKAVTAHELAGGLSRYSERGKAYVKEIRAMIRVNYQLMSG